MLFTKLKLNYFGRFQNREIELKPGINLIYGENEAGKSTIHTFIRGMLFGIERARGRGAATRDDIYTRYLPWDYPGAYGGSMDIRIGDREYRLQRSFHANDKYFKVLDVTTGREVKLKEGLISELIPGLTESTFKNTISVEQLKAQTDAELSEQVRNYITNLSITKSNEVNVAKALSLLTDQRKTLEPTQNMAAIKALQIEIAEGLEREEQIDRLTIQRKELLAREQQLKDQKAQMGLAVSNEESERMAQLPAILEKYRSYQAVSKQLSDLQQQEMELRGKISSWEMEQRAEGNLKEDLKMVEQLNLKLIELERQELEVQREINAFATAQAKKRLFLTVPVFLLAVLALLFLGVTVWGISVALILMALGIILPVLQNKKSNHQMTERKERLDYLRRQKAEVQEATSALLRKNQVTKPEALAAKQEVVLKDFYSLENAKQQMKAWELRSTELEDHRDALYETIMKYMQHFVEEEELTESAILRLQQEIKNRRQETQGRLTELNSQCENCRLKIEKLQWEISTLEGNEEQLLKNQDLYKEMVKKQKESAIHLEAIRLALATIQELSTDIHDTFGQQLNLAVSEIISEMTDQRYQDLKVDEKLDVKVGWNGAYVLLDRLSAGTIDQVYFALRLTVADLLLGKEEIPLLLDDSFALYDESRVKAALTKISQRTQILLFTCHKREKALLDELGLPYHFVDLSCR